MFLEASDHRCQFLRPGVRRSFVAGVKEENVRYRNGRGVVAGDRLV
jgi:hypothetical protein